MVHGGSGAQEQAAFLPFKGAETAAGLGKLKQNFHKFSFMADRACPAPLVPACTELLLRGWGLRTLPVAHSSLWASLWRTTSPNARA